MRKRVLRQWPWLLILALAAILNAGVNVVLALYLGWVVDQAAASAQDKFGAMILLGLGVMAAGMVIFLFHAYVDATVKNRLLEQTREKLFQDIYSQSMVRFSQVNTAEYLSRMTNDMKLVEENYLAPYLSVIQNIVAILVSVGLFLYYAPMVLLVIIVGIVVIFVIPSLMGSIMQKKQQAFSDQSEVFTNRLKDFFSGFEVIASAGRRREAEREFTGENREFTKKKLSSEKWKAANMMVSQILAVGVQFSVMVACAWYIMQGRMTVGTLLVLVQIMNIFIGPIMGLIAAFPQMKGAKPIIEKIESYVQEAEQIELPGFSEGIRLQNIDFSYGEGGQILKEVELSVEKGKKYVLVGPSGCGKTTLLKLLAGYFEDYGGCITVDGRTLEPQDSARLFSLCALIHQNIFLFDKSIRDNICLYRPCDDSELREAVEKSGVAKFLREELNLDSMTGEDGSKLSGGQRQRIAIARALIQKKPLILLDEGTSSLDPQTACEIERDLLENDEITLLTITHHFQRELMEKYDCVVFMKDGRILGAGSYGELLKNNQEFAKFVEQN